MTTLVAPRLKLEALNNPPYLDKCIFQLSTEIHGKLAFIPVLKLPHNVIRAEPDYCTMPRALPPIDGATPAKLSSSFVELVAGFTAGAAATLAVHPFDVLKTRLQSTALTLQILALLMLAS